ncbi:MAG: hypothetical protein Q4D39_05630, partial [Coriobacteriaceae bacterium]|nr:hypothetical protein [Coriobacteriaceae bacterium]
MAPSESELRETGRRLLLARMRLLSEHGFYGLLLMHMRFAIGDELDTAWVSSDTITFNPEFMGRLSDEELDFVLEHEVLHAALGHVSRGLGYEDPELFNVACDIVVNSNILYSNDMDHKSITLSEFGESMHRTPSGDEGYDYTAEEVYDMLLDRGMAIDGAPSTDDLEPSDAPRGSRAARGRGNPHGHSARDTESGILDEVRRRGRGGRWDWHVPSDGAADGEGRGEWVQRLRDAREAMRARDPSGKRGLVPLGVERLLDELDEPRADWRLLLNDF